MNPRLRSILIVIGLLTVIIVAIILIPRGLSLYYQSRGGQQVEYVLRSVEGLQELVCEALPLSNQTAIGEVEQGIADLNRAVRLNRNNSQAYYYLGKAHCLLGEPNEAKENYVQYTELRPDNPLGHIGLGFAYEKLGESSAAKHAWKTAGINQDDLFRIGDQEFEADRYKNAIRWYSAAEILNGALSKSRQFVWAVAEILSGKPSPERVESSILPVVSVGNAVQIEGETLRWFSPIQGGIVESYTSGDTIAGGLWWTGCALTAIQINDTGEYRLTIRVQDSPPAPTAFQIQHNFTTIQEFSLVKEDNKWKQLDTESYFDVGIHLLSICFLNDGSSNGMDRNLLIDYITISSESF